MGEYVVLRNADTGGRRSGKDTTGIGSGRDGWFELLGAFGASNDVTGGV